jgi:hypothetical protein
VRRGTITDAAVAVMKANVFATQYPGPYGIIYGPEGDFPDLEEDGPFGTLSDLWDAFDRERAERVGGVTFVAEYEESDGQTIISGAGRVITTELDG